MAPSENMPLEAVDQRDPSSIEPLNNAICSTRKRVQLASEQSVSMPSNELEPLNLTISSIEANQKRPNAVEPVYGISSTSNTQGASYLDEPIASPGPFLGKTRLVDDYNGRSRTNHPDLMANNFEKLNSAGISDISNRNGALPTDMKLIASNAKTSREKTGEHLTMTEIESPLAISENAKNEEKIISNIGKSAIDHHLDAISSTSELPKSHKLAKNAVKLETAAADSVSMQIAEISSSVNPLLVATDEAHSAATLPPIESKPKTAKRIASEYMELTNKQVNSTTSAIDERRTSSDSFVIVNKKNENAKRARVMSIGADVLVSGNSSKSTPSQIPFIQKDDGPLKCTICSANFPKSSLLKMHMNIHYMNPERKFHCDACDKSFRTQNRLHKHACFETKIAKTNKNPRPFNCSDCSIAFRIHGHLAKHLRSKTHIQNLENLEKLPSGTYALIEKAQINLSDIDTSDCDNSLESLKLLAKKLNNGNPNSMNKEEAE